MFFAEDRIPHMQAMILARDEKTRREGLQKLLPMQRKGFAGLFTAMNGYPVVIRTLDPPLHEFLPKRENLMVDLAKLPRATAKERGDLAATYGVTVPELKTHLPELLERVEELHEFNPMLGHRGCRLGITYPEITEMQARAIFEAVVLVARKGQEGDSGSHDSADWRRQGAGEPKEDRGRDRRRSAGQGRHEGPEVSGGHH